MGEQEKKELSPPSKAYPFFQIIEICSHVKFVHTFRQFYASNPMFSSIAVFGLSLGLYHHIDMTLWRYKFLSDETHQVWREKLFNPLSNFPTAFAVISLLIIITKKNYAHDKQQRLLKMWSMFGIQTIMEWYTFITLKKKKDTLLFEIMEFSCHLSQILLYETMKKALFLS